MNLERAHGLNAFIYSFQRQNLNLEFNKVYML